MRFAIAFFLLFSWWLDVQPSLIAFASRCGLAHVLFAPIFTNTTVIGILYHSSSSTTSNISILCFLLRIWWPILNHVTRLALNRIRIRRHILLRGMFRAGASLVTAGASLVTAGASLVRAGVFLVRAGASLARVVVGYVKELSVNLVVELFWLAT